MEKLHSRKWSVLCVIFVILSCQTKDPAKEAENVAENYLEHFYACELDDASKYCSKEAKEDLAWYASNLTDEELGMITSRPEINILGSDLQGDTLARVRYKADKILITDSLEHRGHIGSKEGSVEVKRIGRSWKIMSER